MSNVDTNSRTWIAVSEYVQRRIMVLLRDLENHELSERETQLIRGSIAALRRLLDDLGRRGRQGV